MAFTNTKENDLEALIVKWPALVFPAFIQFPPTLQTITKNPSI